MITVDSKLGEILNNEAYKAIFDEVIPGLSSNDMVGVAKGMAIKHLLKYPQAKKLGFTKEAVQEILDRVNAL
ncbi:MAG: hypothetical protein IJH75_05595 [Mogibacterium sp.]|nr:hypothetical protein [Mogibacterium sp.]